MKRYALVVVAAFLSLNAATCPPKPPTPPVDRHFKVSLRVDGEQPLPDASRTKLNGFVSLTWGVSARAEPQTVGQVEFAGIPDCPQVITVNAKATGYLPNVSTWGPPQVACGDMTQPGAVIFLTKLAPDPPPVNPLPPPPTRDQILSLKFDFQGFDCDTNGDGKTEIVWEPTIAAMPLAERKRTYACKHAQGDTHINLTLDKGGLASLDAILNVVDEAARERFWSVLMLMGDGNGSPDEPNYDPGALGYHWLSSNFQAIHDRVKARGLKPYVVFVPGYDGVVPGWQPFTRVNAWAGLARSTLGEDGYSGIEMSAGYGHSWSGENDDFHTADGQHFDLVLWEGPIDFGPLELTQPANFCSQSNETRAPFDQIWQTSKRMLGPLWVRPSDQPACDDPGSYSGGPSTVTTPRGKMFVSAFEFSTYKRVRLGRLTAAQVDANRQYLRRLGWPHVN